MVEGTSNMREITTAKNDKQIYYLLSNSDRPGDQLVIHLLKGTNYPTWRRAITNALVSKHKIVFVDGRLPKPAEGDPDEENWITCNSMVRSWIINSLNEELHDSIVYHDTARDEELESSQNGEDDNNQLAQVEDLKPVTRPTRARQPPRHLEDYVLNVAKEENVPPLHARAKILIFTITSIAFMFLLSVFMSFWLGATVLGLGEWFIKKMPPVSYIYSSSKQINAAMSPDQKSNAFKEVAIIRHRRMGVYAFGFITSAIVLGRVLYIYIYLYIGTLEFDLLRGRMDSIS
ncbi:Retrotransposon Copia-like, N-terminal [Dillenia turbinata]|uniref:Retrotransposon Copia-like, N-terminal n=1 Tax=Dillenia turbinata TaxID=194707 RepID=A0AAN8VSL6_9MAGN